MLKLNNITKVYELGDLKVEALKGVSLCFRKNEFVSILGPSGCGKTTMLNIIGGLDRYTTGDLVINGKSTKEYKDKDWDIYRNHSIGFVFQSYNLIPHQTVLENVELALTLSGVSKQERKKRATDVLIRVGLGDKLKNKPSQLSGGQMQRVAIARALVNDPEIILADEPTGALDTETSVQIMELLKKISKDKLIIMVTHNPALAEQYSTRIVNLLDGNVTGDSDPFSEEDELAETEETNAKKLEKQKRQKLTEKDIKRIEGKKKMSFWTALSLSFKNLLTKKARTILVAFAGSIGIIGIALILAVSSGFSTYINKMQEDTLSTYPITIKSQSVDFSEVIASMFVSSATTEKVEHENEGVYPKENISTVINSVGKRLDTNNLEKFYAYINAHYDELKPYVNAVQYTYDLDDDFYINSTDTDSSISYSNSIMQMIIRYSLAYFESETSAGYTYDSKTGSCVLTRPTNLPEIEGINYQTNYADPTDDDLMEQLYPFIYRYDALKSIAVGFESNSSHEVTLTAAQVTDLVSAVLGLGSGALTSAFSGSGSSLMSSSKPFYEMIDNKELLSSQYDVLAGKFAENEDEAILVLDSNSEIDDYVLYAYGLLSDSQIDTILKNKVENKTSTTYINYSSILNTTYKILDTVDYYVDDGTGTYVDLRKTSSGFDATQQSTLKKTALSSCENTIKIVGIVRVKENTTNGSLNTGIAYLNKFTQKLVNYHNSEIENKNITELSKLNLTIPSTISLYINSFDSKESVKAFIEKYNAQVKNEEEKITYSDTVGIIMSTVSTIINAITYVLVAFVSVSLVVSSIMIGIITYISVIERTKEIGVLRSVGASKKDIKRVFTAESFIIGLASGLLGIGISLLLILPINLILGHFTGIAGLANLPVVGSIVLVVISVILTLISGLIPAKAAAKKDPVIALREN